MNLLLTGATGFIGQHLVRKLAAGGHRLFLLVRSSSLEAARERFKDVKDVVFIEGDIEETDVVKNIYSVSRYLDEIDGLVHLAACYDLEASLTRAYVGNVLGTQNILNLIGKMRTIKHFYYFSTYAVNPVAQGAVHEDLLLGDDLPFHDQYSKTKNHAEHLVRKFKKDDLRTIILRPGIIIGDSETGAFGKKDGPYFFWDFIQKLKKIELLRSQLPFIPLPMKKYSYLPVLPVDVLCEWCSEIIARPPVQDIRCYHLVPNPTIKTVDFLEASLKLLGMPVKILPLSQTKLLANFLPLMNIPAEASFYMNQQTVFDKSHLLADYPHLKTPSYQSYLPNIIAGYLGGRR